MKNLIWVGLLCVSCAVLACGSSGSEPTKVADAPSVAQAGADQGGTGSSAAPIVSSAGAPSAPAEAGAGGQPDAVAAAAGAGGEAGATVTPIVLSIVLSGQSNAVGQGVYTGTWTPDPRVAFNVDGVAMPLAPQNGLHGIELSLAPALATAYGSVSFGKAAFNGEACRKFAFADGSIRPELVAAIKASITPATNHAAFVWIQGEADAVLATSQADYTLCLHQLFAGVRALYSIPVEAYILPLNAYWRAAPFWNTLPITNAIYAAQLAVGSEPHNHTASADDMTPALGGFHYDSAQLLTIGDRFAKSIEMTFSGGQF